MNTAFMLGWFVGIIEGEGTIRAGKDGSLHIGITQKNRWILDQVVGLFGGKVCTQGVRAFQWYAYGKTAEQLAGLVFPYLSPHRQTQFKIALDKYHKV